MLLTFAFAFGDFESLLQNFGLARTSSKIRRIWMWRWQK